jgi:hypothetical protein
MWEWGDVWQLDGLSSERATDGEVSLIQKAASDGAAPSRTIDAMWDARSRTGLLSPRAERGRRGITSAHGWGQFATFVKSRSDHGKIHDCYRISIILRSKSLAAGACDLKTIASSCIS